MNRRRQGLLSNRAMPFRLCLRCHPERAQRVRDSLQFCIGAFSSLPCFCSRCTRASLLPPPAAPSAAPLRARFSSIPCRTASSCRRATTPNRTRNSRPLFPPRPRRKRADAAERRRLESDRESLGTKADRRIPDRHAQRRPQLLHQLARRPGALRGFLHPRVSAVHREPLSHSTPAAMTAASPAFPWAATARCVSLSAIPQLFGSVSAHSAALVAKLPEVRSFEPAGRRRSRA